MGQKRRDFMKTAGAGAAAFAAHQLGNTQEAHAAQDKPNFVFIMTDQQRWDTLGHLGFDYAITPNIDAIASEGVTFSHAVIQSAVCCPSRASVVSSKYSHSHGAITNGMWLLPHEPNWIEDLRSKGGYHTANIGKMHTRPVDLECGYDYRFVVENKNHRADERYGDDDYQKVLDDLGLRRPGVYYNETVDGWWENLNTAIWPLDEELYQDNFVGDMSVDYINDYDFDEQPLFLWVGFSGPHDPYDITRSALERYPNDAPIPEALGIPNELDTKPPYHREFNEQMEQATHTAAVKMKYATPEKIKRLRRYYHANIMLIDEWVGKLIDAVKEKGVYDNTIFVFVSDHGDALCDHQQIYKFSSCYDSVVRVPLVMCGPGIEKLGISNTQAELIDIGPTVLDLAGVEQDKRFQGQSFAPVLSGETDTHKDTTFCEFGLRTMIRTHDWKLVFWRDQPFGELYDLRSDPEELYNLYTDKSYDETRLELTSQLLAWQTANKFNTRFH